MGDPKGQVRGVEESRGLDYLLTTCGYQLSIPSSCGEQTIPIDPDASREIQECAGQLLARADLPPLYRQWAVRAQQAVVAAATRGRTIPISLCLGQREDRGLDKHWEDGTRTLLNRFHLAGKSQDLDDYFHGTVVSLYDDGVSDRLAILYANYELFPEVQQDLAHGIYNQWADGVSLIGIEGLVAGNPPATCQQVGAFSGSPGLPVTPAHYILACEGSLSVDLVGLEGAEALADGVRLWTDAMNLEDPHRLDACFLNSDERSRIAAANFDQALHDHHASVGILSFGVNHIDRIKRELRDRGISYLVVLPRSISVREYEDRPTGGFLR